MIHLRSYNVFLQVSNLTPESPVKEIEVFARRWGANGVSFNTGGFSSRTKREVIRDVDVALRRRLSGNSQVRILEYNRSFFNITNN